MLGKKDKKDIFSEIIGDYKRVTICSECMELGSVRSDLICCICGREHNAFGVKEAIGIKTIIARKIYKQPRSIAPGRTFLRWDILPDSRTTMTPGIYYRIFKEKFDTENF